uniref:CSON012283 protein n=1 Tax=Culicoides sonorensis TaxID=179676 RepID=A0A336LZK1_CULSO
MYIESSTVRATTTFFKLAPGNESNPGKSSISPVFKLKQAPCHGQRTRPSPREPVSKGAPK